LKIIICLACGLYYKIHGVHRQRGASRHSALYHQRHTKPKQTKRPKSGPTILPMNDGNLEWTFHQGRQIHIGDVVMVSFRTVNPSIQESYAFVRTITVQGGKTLFSPTWLTPKTANPIQVNDFQSGFQDQAFYPIEFIVHQMNTNMLRKEAVPAPPTTLPMMAFDDWLNPTNKSKSAAKHQRQENIFSSQSPLLSNDNMVTMLSFSDNNDLYDCVPSAEPIIDGGFQLLLNATPIEDFNMHLPGIQFDCVDNEGND
jgi:hypothetical protein